MEDSAREDVLNEAWSIYRQLVFNGTVVLENGRTFDPADKGTGDFLRAVGTLLHFKPPKAKRTPALDGWAAAQTNKVPTTDG